MKLTWLVEERLVPALQQRAPAFRAYWQSWCSGRTIALAVPASPWTRDKRQYSLVGTTFDYLIGAV
ncbi:MULTISPECIES: hypothetical protein [Sorangium]|uniref:hypothetical protein n=1 Tax=Sorangium TaxID=39643 RepID=UPI003D9C578C